MLHDGAQACGLAAAVSIALAVLADPSGISDSTGLGTKIGRVCIGTEVGIGCSGHRISTAERAICAADLRVSGCALCVFVVATAAGDRGEK